MEAWEIWLIVAAIIGYIAAYFIIRAISPVRNGVRYISGKFVALLGLLLYVAVYFLAGWIFKF